MIVSPRGSCQNRVVDIRNIIFNTAVTSRLVFERTTPIASIANHLQQSMQKLVAIVISLFLAASASAVDRPNILWITCEDISPNLDCYGDHYAVTPNLDALAARGLRSPNAIPNAPGCAPARTTIITGLYPPSTGSEHMRSLVNLPARFRLFPQFLRDAGSYATNNSKEDYNVEKPGKIWDVSSAKAHWKNRRNGQVFFAVFNHVITHE